VRSGKKVPKVGGELPLNILILLKGIFSQGGMIGQEKSLSLAG
jgi:hypothetical protein